MKIEVATLAGGCFWGLEDLLRRIPGVQEVEVGYTGGLSENASYQEVKTGRTGHAESVQIKFDSSVLTYEQVLLQFFRMHDPTTKNQQGNDRGTQYRSVIFYHTPEQRATAEAVILRVDRSQAWKGPVVTEIIPAGPWWRAEEDHQDYLLKNSEGYTCHYLRNFEF
jgi:methionine-S-sulfoxide reductase